MAVDILAINRDEKLLFIGGKSITIQAHKLLMVSRPKNSFYFSESSKIIEVNLLSPISRTVL